MKKLILHIGAWKTGTTSIQETLFHNREELLKNKTYYHDVLPNNIFLIPLFKENHQEHVAVKSFKQGLTELKKIGKDFIKRIPEILKHHDTIILSSEFLLDLNKNEIEKIKYELSDYFDNITVVCYVRAPISHFTSAVNEQVKQGHYPLELAYEKHIDIKEYDRIEYWSDIFGIDNMIISAFDKEKFHDGNLIKDFLKRNGIPEFNEGSFKDKENSTLSNMAVYIASEIAKIAPSFSNERPNCQFLHNIKGPRFFIPEELQRKCKKINKERISKIEKTFKINLNEEITSQEQKLNIDEIKSIAHILYNKSLNERLLSDKVKHKEALLLISKKDFNSAKKKLESIIDINNFDYLRDYAHCLYILKDYKNAITFAKKSLVLNPNAPWPKEIINNSIKKQ